MKKLIIILFLFSIVNCERDDICAEATPTTPQLIISFNNNQTLDDPKNVRELTVLALDQSLNPIAQIGSTRTTDQIALPLEVQDENETTAITTRYALVKDTDFDEDEDPATSSNTDIIEITYTTEFVYVSRACGFKSNFNLDPSANTAFNIVTDSDNWATNFAIQNFTIDNENETHVIIYH